VGNITPIYNDRKNKVLRYDLSFLPNLGDTMQEDERAKNHDMIKCKGRIRECVKDFHECQANVRKHREYVNRRCVNMLHVKRLKK
jgi:hypothetical protein